MPLRQTEVFEVTVKCEGSNDRKKNLRITMGLQLGYRTCDLVVTFADVTDHSFMFSCCLCQEDFLSLKERYGILAQCGSFPEALMQYFGKCGSDQSSSKSRHYLLLSSDSPSLDGSAELSLMKTNELASVTIFSLTLTRATVEQVKKYLRNRVTLLQAQKESLELQLDKTKADLEQAQSCLQQQTQHRSEVEQAMDTVDQRLRQALQCLGLSFHDLGKAHKMVAKLQRQFATLKNRQKTELRSLFEEQ
ncbi:spindle assembly abnormal protein 6 homolog isoform X2 [Stigmatopora argus]